MALLQLQNACLAFGHTPLLDDANLVLERKERLCLIGRNGTGKSSLLKVIQGQQSLDSGVLRISDTATISTLAQDVPAGGDASIYATVAAGLGGIAELLLSYHKASTDVAGGDEAALQRLSQIQTEIERRDAWDASQKVDSVLSKLKLPGDALMAQCSGGMRRRAMLAQALVQEPDLLLLDEPTNHLDIAAIDALERDLISFNGTVMFITHDRAFINALATRIVELDRGILRDYPGNYAAYQSRKALELEAEATQAKHADKHLAAEEVWIRQGIKARRTRNEGRVRRLQSLRQARAERLERQGNVKMQIDTGQDSGKIVLEAESVSLSFDETPLLDAFSTTILRGDRIGIIGPNGSGKTTLIKLLLGELTPQSGHIRQGTRINIAYFDQERAQLDPSLSVRDNLAPGTDQIEIGGKTKHVMSYLKEFLFAPARANSPVSALSGGERNRLLLAKLFAAPANLLVLDEPTNDLDVETLELLEELLEGYTGTVLLVSHDRAFLDQTITSTLVMQGNGQVREFVGGYADWQAQVSRESSHQTNVSKEHPGNQSSLASSKSILSATTSNQGAKSKKPRLSYKLQRELEALPESIEQLESQQSELTQRVSSTDFYAQEQEVINETLERLAALGKELEQTYERWAELEEAAQKH